MHLSTSKIKKIHVIKNQICILYYNSSSLPICSPSSFFVGFETRAHSVSPANLTTLLIQPHLKHLDNWQAPSCLAWKHCCYNNLQISGLILQLLKLTIIGSHNTNSSIYVSIYSSTYLSSFYHISIYIYLLSVFMYHHLIIFCLYSICMYVRSMYVCIYLLSNLIYLCLPLSLPEAIHSTISRLETSFQFPSSIQNFVHLELVQILGILLKLLCMCVYNCPAITGKQYLIIITC